MGTRLPKGWFARCTLLAVVVCFIAAVSWGVCWLQGSCGAAGDADGRAPSAASQGSFLDTALAALPSWLTGEKTQAKAASAAAQASHPAFAAGGALAPPVGSLDAASYNPEREARKALLEAQREVAETNLTSYTNASRYSLTSRPISENHDQAYLFEPLVHDNALIGDDKGKLIPGVRWSTTQNRVFMSGADSVVLSVQAFNEKGEVLPITVKSALAQSAPESKALTTLISSPVQFADGGGSGDAVAGDGRFTSVFSPATQGFERFRGTIRTIADVQIGKQVGRVVFDVDYSPGVPAQWLGVRDALEAGSLSVYLKANVAVAGSYRVSARVDDAKGAPFALLDYANDAVATGEQEFKLTLLGLLVLDKKPTFPLRIRDVQGYVLEAGQPTDRQMMPRWAGIVHRTGSYPLSSFSSAEWQGEQRTRMLEIFKLDLKKIEAELSTLR